MTLVVKPRIWLRALGRLGHRLRRVLLQGLFERLLCRRRPVVPEGAPPVDRVDRRDGYRYRRIGPLPEPAVELELDIPADLRADVERLRARAADDLPLDVYVDATAPWRAAGSEWVQSVNADRERSRELLTAAGVLKTGAAPQEPNASRLLVVHARERPPF